MDTKTALQERTDEVIKLINNLRIEQYGGVFVFNVPLGEAVVANVMGFIRDNKIPHLQCEGGYASVDMLSRIVLAATAAKKMLVMFGWNQLSCIEEYTPEAVWLVEKFMDMGQLVYLSNSSLVDMPLVAALMKKHGVKAIDYKDIKEELKKIRS